MKDLRKNSHKCRDCRFYEGIYAKFAYGFMKQNCGMCFQKQTTVKNHEVCELFKRRLQTEKIVTQEHLDIVMEDLKELEKNFQRSDFL